MRIFLIGLILLFLFSGCGVPAANAPNEHTHTAMESGLVPVLAVARDPNGLLLPVERRLPAGAKITARALALLTASPENADALSRLGLLPVLPDGVTFEVTERADRAITVNVCALPELYGKDAELSAVTGIVNTACACGALSVRLVFNGKARETLSHGTDVSAPFSALPWNPEPLAASALGSARHTVTLFYPNAAKTALLPVTRYLFSPPTPASALGALIQNAKLAQLPACFPKNLLLDYVRLSDGTATLSFSSELAALTGDPLLFQQAMRCILLTVKQFREVRRVRLEIEGVPFGDGDYALPDAVNPLY